MCRERMRRPSRAYLTPRHIGQSFLTKFLRPKSGEPRRASHAAGESGRAGRERGPLAPTLTLAIFGTSRIFETQANKRATASAAGAGAPGESD
ncbi:hypothetical protein EVAR_56913_1 [Eumeta japonica]|uniref:Uncharacterized protein n=1 Tax=Eumeta variegata TaxID=151549 RepID=A0A4C1YG62_EUMVA|nr:hypothetical protein EVAR_56913_1 [Eumeta japonica]